jgi:hypothetical protein
MVREIVEARISEDDASQELPRDCGEVLGGSVRRVLVDKTDPLFAQIARIDARWRSERGEGFVLFNRYHREYTDDEIERAEVFDLEVTSVFEPAGEERGTVYDDSSACEICGTGRRQVSPLRLNLNKVPKRADIAATIADEVIFSERLVRAFEEASLTGFDVRAVEHTGRSGPGRSFFQLAFDYQSVRLTDATKGGIGIFDEDSEGEYRCPLGHRRGLNLISEVFVDRSTWPGKDLATTKEYFGVRRGLLQPHPLILISSRLRQMLVDTKARGWSADIAYLVSD